MEIRIDVAGLDEVIRVMNRLPGLLSERVQGDGLLAAAREVRDVAKIRVPVDTGALRNSIRAVRRSGRFETVSGFQRVPGAAARVIAGGPGARHAFLVEGGTVKTRAQPLPSAVPPQYSEPAAYRCSGCDDTFFCSVGSSACSRHTNTLSAAHFRLPTF